MPFSKISNIFLFRRIIKSFDYITKAQVLAPTFGGGSGPPHSPMALQIYINDVTCHHPNLLHYSLTKLRSPKVLI